MADARIWYIVKTPGGTYAPGDLRSAPKDAWAVWLKRHPAYQPFDPARAAIQAMSLEGVRLCTVVTQETGVINGSGLDR
jgi:hypothetical protein